MQLRTSYILTRLGELDIRAFDSSEFRRLLRGSVAATSKALSRLVRAGFARRLARDRYVFTPPGSVPPDANALFVGTRLVEPSYVSFWTALNLHGMTEQAPRTVFLASTVRSGPARAPPHSFRYVRLAPSRYFGYESFRQADLEFPTATKEKAVVDSLFAPDNAGGVEEVASAVSESAAELDGESLFAAARNMGSSSLCSRLGHLLDAAGVESGPLHGAASKVYVKLDPSGPRRGKYDARWRVIDNMGEE